MRAERAAIAAGLCLLVVAGYSGVTGLEFLAYDDDVYVTANPFVRGGLRPEAVVAAFTTVHAGNWHPLTWLSHMLDVSLFGLTPAGPHAVNAALHAANAVLAFLALSELTGTTWRAALAAALFAIHPLRVESVAWIAERKDVLSACFGLAALWAWARFARTGSSRAWWGSLALFAAGLLAKPMLVTFPFLLLLLDFWPLRRAGSVREKAPFFALAAASCLVTLYAQGSGIHELPFAVRLENAAVAYAEYLRRVVAPSELAAIYPYRAHLDGRAVALSLALLAALSAFALFQARRRPWFLVGWLWFTGTLVPTLGLVQVGVQAFADRYTYLPFVGLAVIAAYAAGELAERAPWARVATIGATFLALAACTAKTRAQVETWHDTVSVFAHAVEVTRSNWFAHTEEGIALAARGELDPARESLEAALRIRPDYPRALANLGQVLIQSGDSAAGIESLQRALATDPGLAGGWLALASGLERAERLADAESAYRRAIDDPRSGREARLRLARLLSVAPDPALRDGAEALALCDEACRGVSCDSPEELDIRAMALMEAGRRDEAVATAQRAASQARIRGDSAYAAKLEARAAGYERGEPSRLRLP